jgi:hypothetical protein
MTQDSQFIVARQRLTDRRAITQNHTVQGTQNTLFLLLAAIARLRFSRGIVARVNLGSF